MCIRDSYNCKVFFGDGGCSALRKVRSAKTFNARPRQKEHRGNNKYSRLLQESLWTTPLLMSSAVVDFCSPWDTQVKKCVNERNVCVVNLNV
eukprot:920665-Amphidinium_carterae.1